jgi:hypothetical protein
MGEDSSAEISRAFRVWEEGLQQNNSEMRWRGLFNLIDIVHTNRTDGAPKLEILLDLSFWEALELVPSHPRRELVTNLLYTLGTWSGYFRLALEYIRICILSRWVDVGYGKDLVIARQAHLEILRENVRRNFGPSIGDNAEPQTSRF